MPMGRRGTMEEVAEAVVWLVSDKSSYITGHPLVLDGGFMAQWQSCGNDKDRQFWTNFINLYRNSNFLLTLNVNLIDLNDHLK